MEILGKMAILQGNFGSKRSKLPTVSGSYTVRNGWVDTTSERVRERLLHFETHIQDIALAPLKIF